jgi:glucans biosynthesis protein
MELPDTAVHRLISVVARLFGAVGLLICCVCSLVPRTAGAMFQLDDVAAKAQKMAGHSFQDPGTIPDWLSRITYDQWREIRFLPDRALWRQRDKPFQIQFFHPGYYYNRAVTVNLVDANGVHPIPFSPNDFSYGRNDFASRVPQNLGFAGLRVHAPIKRPDYFDEVIVFLGASYFRAVGRDQVFGLSGRGIAIDTGLPSGEEFPFFRELWVVEPVAWATDLVIYALLDSPSLTGAYRFIVRPGAQTTIDVEARLFLRREVQQIGIAPLTSMYFLGESNPRGLEDFRPEVHDSDGVLLHFMNGEWLWRPLSNPRTLQMSSLRMNNPRGFGLLQRDRDFDHYQDLETRRELRPSAWVRPHGDWGLGRVMTVEIPTKSDTNDNIVCFWVPDRSPKPGEPFVARYSLIWFGDETIGPPGGRVVASRRDRGNQDDAHRFVIDFAGGTLSEIPADTVIRGAVTVASGEDTAEILEQQVIKNEPLGGWRLIFQVRPRRSEPIELRAYLDLGGRALTETWSYQLVQ